MFYAILLATHDVIFISTKGGKVKASLKFTQIENNLANDLNIQLVYSVIQLVLIQAPKEFKKYSNYISRFLIKNFMLQNYKKS